MEDNEGFTQVAIGTEGANRAFANVEQQKHGLFAQFYMHPKQNAVIKDALYTMKQSIYVLLSPATKPQ